MDNRGGYHNNGRLRIRTAVWLQDKVRYRRLGLHASSVCGDSVAEVAYAAIVAIFKGTFYLLHENELKRKDAEPDRWVKRTLLASTNAAGGSSLSSRLCSIRSRICSIFVSGRSSISCAWLRKCSTSKWARISAAKSFIGMRCEQTVIKQLPLANLSSRSIKINQSINK